MTETFSTEYKFKVDSTDKLSKNYSKKVEFLQASMKLKDQNIRSLKLKIDNLAKRIQDLELDLHVKTTELNKKVAENE
jgi:seryl-tRNA synthetase